MKNALKIVCVVAFCFFQQSAFGCQDDVLRGSLEKINEESVTKTISYLASDELGGRGTPSPGFTIASEYVAKRFEAAGLEPGGIEGWYQNHEIKTLRMPTEGIHIQHANGDPIEHFGLLAATDERFEYSGPVTKVNLAHEFSEGQFNGPVLTIEMVSPGNRRYLNSIVRASNRLKQAGATALIIVVPEDHLVVEQAKQSAGKDRVVNTAQRMAIPVLLVRELDAGSEIKMDLPAAIASQAVVGNTIGILKGSDDTLAKEAILFTAHLDHLGTNPNAAGDQIYNGADDDASGVTGVLTLADAFGALPVRPKRSIIFMTLWGEEQGLLGSKQFAAEPTWPLEQIVANVNIEMIGRPEPGAAGKIWMTGWGESNLGVLMNEAAEKNGGTIFEHPQYSARLYSASDNWSFVEKGVIAHSFSAGSLHGDYHQPGDEWEKLDTEHMTRVVRSLFHAALPIANGDATPKSSANRRGQ